MSTPNMNFLPELENMAANAATDSLNEISADDISHWQHLFGYTATEAESRIEQQRRDIGRLRISDEQWEILHDAEALGFGREAYEHKMMLDRQAAMAPAIPSRGAVVHRLSPSSNATYLLKLGALPLLETAAQVGEAAGLDRAPEVLAGHADDDDDDDEDDSGSADGRFFCRVSGPARQNIEAWLRDRGVPARAWPAFVRITKADKDFSPTSPHPTLGISATLPQNRPNRLEAGQFVPEQDQYPVWYFFYGTLADADTLRDVVGVEALEYVDLVRANVFGGALKMWGGKYKALLDGPPTSKVEGWAFEVASRDQEDALRFYETDRYEVVRCRIQLNREGEHREVMGCTFRFVVSEGAPLAQSSLGFLNGSEL